MDYWGKLRKVCDVGDEISFGLTREEEFSIKSSETNLLQFEFIKERLSKTLKTNSIII